MRILYLHQYFTTRAGATGTRSYEMAKALVARGHQVHMVCATAQVAASGLQGPFVHGKRTGVVDGIHITEFALAYANKDSLIKRSLTFVRYASRCVHIALFSNYDLLFATSTPLTSVIPGIVAKICRRKPFVFEVRDLWPELPRAMGVITNPVVLAAMSMLEWCIYRSSDACIGLSPGIVHGIKRRSRDELPVKLIPNGCDLDLFSYTVSLPSKSTHVENGDSSIPEGNPLTQPKTPADGTALAGENTIDPPLFAVFAGAHGRANGLVAVLDAAAVLKARGRRNIRLVFITNLC